jgi:hypothetical protein
LTVFRTGDQPAEEMEIEEDGGLEVMTMGPTPMTPKLFELKLEAVKACGADWFVESASVELDFRHLVA